MVGVGSCWEGRGGAIEGIVWVEWGGCGVWYVYMYMICDVYRNSVIYIYMVCDYVQDSLYVYGFEGTVRKEEKVETEEMKGNI